MTTTASLAAALVAFQADLPRVAKNKTARVPMKGGGSYSYTYADLADLTAAAIPALVRHGLAFTTSPSIVDGRPCLTGILTHESGETMTGTLPIQGGSPQEVGSAITYARRYLLGSMTGIVTEDDDDGSIAQEAHHRQQEGQSEALAAEQARAALAAWARETGRDLGVVAHEFEEEHGHHINQGTAAEIRAYFEARNTQTNDEAQEPTA